MAFGDIVTNMTVRADGVAPSLRSFERQVGQSLEEQVKQLRDAVDKLDAIHKELADREEVEIKA